MATTAELKAALLGRYSGEAWALFFEVPDGTGGNKVRSADAIAMSLWPSRGLRLHGHELKASRADWLKELKRPQKAESICQFCDHWWIVAGDKSIVRQDELPPTWGLIVLSSRGLVTEKAAPSLSPLPIDRSFLAGLLRSAGKTTARDDAAIIQAARNKGYDEGVKQAENGDKHTKVCLDRLTESVRRFQEASGIQINQYDQNCEMAKRVREFIAADQSTHYARREAWNILRAARTIVGAVKKSGIVPEAEIADLFKGTSHAHKS